MAISARAMVEAAVRHAGGAAPGLTTLGKSVVIDGGRRGLLWVSAELKDFGHLFHEHPTGGGRQVVLPEGQAVDAIAAWLNGADLPTEGADPTPAPAITAVFDRVWDAVMASLPDALDDADYPGGAYGVEEMTIGGPEDARLVITPRLDGDGAITGAAWAGQRADGSSITGHGSVDAVLAAATDWGSSLDARPVISGAEAQARREATGASQTDLARLMGVGQNAISRWEAGARAPRDPHSYLDAITELEALAEDLYQQALADGQLNGRLSVWRTDRAYWEAVPTAAQQGTPAAMHRVATARAVHTLRTQGVEMRIVAGEDRF